MVRRTALAGRRQGRGLFLTSRFISRISYVVKQLLKEFIWNLLLFSISGPWLRTLPILGWAKWISMAFAS